MSAPDQQAPHSVGIASALAYVEGGLLLLAGLLLLLVSTAVSQALGVSWAVVALLGIVPIALSALFVRGARQLRARSGRTLLLVLGSVVSALQLINLGTLVSRGGTVGSIVMAVVFLAIPAIMTVQLLRPATVTWLRGDGGR